MTLEECKDAMEPCLNGQEVDFEWWLEVANAMPEVSIDRVFTVTSEIEAMSDWSFTGARHIRGKDSSKHLDDNVLVFVDSNNKFARMSLTYDEAVIYLSESDQLEFGAFLKKA